MSKLVISLRDDEGKESILAERDMDEGQDVGYTALSAVPHLLSPKGVVLYLLGLVETKANERRRLSTLWHRLVCEGCEERSQPRGCHEHHKPEWFDRPLPTTEDILAEHKKAVDTATEKLDKMLDNSEISINQYVAEEKKLFGGNPSTSRK